KQYFACRIVQKIIYNFPQKIVFVLLDPVAQKNLGQMLLTTHLQEQHLFLFFVYLFFVNRLCLLHVRYNLCFQDRKSTRLNSSHVSISYAVFCLKKKKLNYI